MVNRTWIRCFFLAVIIKKAQDNEMIRGWQKNISPLLHLLCIKCHDEIFSLRCFFLAMDPSCGHVGMVADNSNTYLFVLYAKKASSLLHGMPSTSLGEPGEGKDSNWRSLCPRCDYNNMVSWNGLVALFSWKHLVSINDVMQVMKTNGNLTIKTQLQPRHVSIQLIIGTSQLTPYDLQICTANMRTKTLKN